MRAGDGRVRAMVRRLGGGARLVALGLGVALVAGIAAGPALDALAEEAEVSRYAPGDLRPPRMVAAELDDYIAAAWEREGLTPTERCGDHEFVRRVYLDLVGAIPTPEQVEAFVADESTTKRRELVNRLLETPGFARHWSQQWSQVLVGQDTGGNGREFNPALFRRWLEEQFAANRAYGELVTEMLTADGTVYENAPVNFSGRREHKPNDLAGAVSQTFLGVQIQCAQCHDHPYEEITQTDFESFAAFFARVRVGRERIPYEKFGPAAQRRATQRLERQIEQYIEQGMTPEKARQEAVRREPKSISISDLDGGVKLRPRVMKRMQRIVGDAIQAEPRFLLAETYEDRPGDNRRDALARWIVDPSNPYTAKALANRYWGWFLGRGFVHPVDDFNSVNIPAVGDALDVLAADTAQSNFDLKRLIRVITSTRAYQLSTAGGERDGLAVEFFAAGPLKQLSPQQVFDSLQVALGTADDPTQLSSDDAGAVSAMDMGARGMMAMDYASRDRSARILQRAARNYFQTFDDDEQTETDSFQGTIPQGLFLMNSSTVNDLLSDPRLSVVPDLVEELDGEKDRVRALFLRTLAREPSDDELKRMVAFVRSQPRHVPDEADGKRKGRGRRGRKLTREDTAHAAYADILWTLVSTTEFASNH